MGKNGTTQTIEAEVPAKALSDSYENITGVWARGMVDGETIEGRYLGFDAIKNEEGQLRRRHRFLLADPTLASPEALDGVEVIFGSTALDLDLFAASLGRMTEVTRLGKSGNRDMIMYRVRQKGPVVGAGVIGREDEPVLDNSGDSSGKGWRGRRARR